MLDHWNFLFYILFFLLGISDKLNDRIKNFKIILADINYKSAINHSVTKSSRFKLSWFTSNFEILEIDFSFSRRWTGREGIDDNDSLKNNIIKVYFTRTNETQHGHVGTQCEKKKKKEIRGRPSCMSCSELPIHIIRRA